MKLLEHYTKHVTNILLQANNCPKILDDVSVNIMQQLDVEKLSVCVDYGFSDVKYQPIFHVLVRSSTLLRSASFRPECAPNLQSM